MCELNKQINKQNKFSETSQSRPFLRLCLLFLSRWIIGLRRYLLRCGQRQKQAAAAAVLIVFTSILLWLIELIAFVDKLVNCHECST